LSAEHPVRPVLAIKRGTKRARLIVPGMLLGAAGEMQVRLRDVSESGALAEAKKAPAKGSEVVLACGGLVVPASIAWAIGRCFGLEFQQPITPAEVAALSGDRRLS
jgi:hypothetical protein